VCDGCLEGSLVTDTPPRDVTPWFVFCSRRCAALAGGAHDDAAAAAKPRQTQQQPHDNARENVLLVANASGAIQHWHMTSGKCLSTIMMGKGDADDQVGPSRPRRVSRALDVAGRSRAPRRSAIARVLVVWRSRAPRLRLLSGGVRSLAL
jgi:hypothetical protein